MTIWGTLYFSLIIAVFWLINPIIILMFEQEKFASSKVNFAGK